MTWIEKVKHDLWKQYRITPRIVENFKTRYKKYNHRATFFFENTEDPWKQAPPGYHRWYFYKRQDYEKIRNLKRSLVDLGDSIKFRNEWHETFVYFESLKSLLDAVPGEYLENIRTLELMNKDTISAKENFTHDYPVELTVRPKLPFDKYRYRVYTATSSKVRYNIGTDNLRGIYRALTAYDGIYIPDRFIQYSGHNWNPDTYFYSETLDWLPLLYMMEPRYIKRIEQFKTVEELQNNDSTT